MLRCNVPYSSMVYNTGDSRTAPRSMEAASSSITSVTEGPRPSYFSSHADELYYTNSNYIESSPWKAFGILTVLDSVSKVFYFDPNTNAETILATEQAIPISDVAQLSY